MQNHFFSQQKAWFIWLLLSSFYFYDYFLRTAPSIMQGELSNFLHVNTSSIGILIAAFYYGYAPAQICAGILFDKYEAKIVMPLAVIFCLIGSLLFLVPEFYLSFLGRLFMGFGAGFAFNGILVVSFQLINYRYHGLLTGLTQTMGMIGAIVGQKYAYLVSHAFSWQLVWQQTSCAALVLAILIWLCIPKNLAEKKSTKITITEIYHYFWLVCRKKETWISGLYGAFIFLPTSVFTVIWAIPYFCFHYHLNINESSTLTSAVFIGWIIGSPFLGWLSDFLQNRKMVLLLGIIGVIVSFCLLAFIQHLSYTLLMMLMFTLGFFSGAELVAITFGCEKNPVEASGTALGLINFIIFLFSAFLTPFLATILNEFGQHTSQKETQFQLAFIVLTFILFLGLGALIFLRTGLTKPDKKEK